MYFLIPHNDTDHNPRIFILDPGIIVVDENDNLVDREIVHRFIQSICLFGGSDKTLPSSKGDWFGYELDRVRYELAVLVLALYLGKPIDRKEALESS